MAHNKMFTGISALTKRLPTAATRSTTLLGLSTSTTPKQHHSIVTRMSSTTPAAEQKPPFPPFTRETAIQKIRMAEDAWNSRDPDRVKMAYTSDSKWRNRDTFLQGREEIQTMLTAKWEKEQEYRLIKELWAVNDDRIAVRFCYEFKDKDSNWFRAYGNENWEFDQFGLMKTRHASINNVAIDEADRKFHWPQEARRPEDHPGLTELGL
jgi:nuclear transport factor 2 (NTF2) superfamily protein